MFGINLLEHLLVLLEHLLFIYYIQNSCMSGINLLVYK